MDSCVVLTFIDIEVEPPFLHYYYIDGENIVDSPRAEQEITQMLAYVGGFTIFKDLSGSSVDRHSVCAIGSGTVGVAKRDQTYIILSKSQRIPNEDMIIALDMVLLLLYSRTKRHSHLCSLPTERLDEPLASSLNSFLFRFLSNSPFALILLRDYHHIPLPRHIMTPILASAIFLNHMRDMLHSTGGAIIRDGKTVVSDLGVLLTNFLLIQCAVETFSEVTTTQAIPTKSLISLQTLYFDEEIGDLATLRMRIQDNNISKLGDVTQCKQNPNIAFTNGMDSNDEMNISVLSISTSNESMEITTFSVQLFIVKCTVHTSMSNSFDSYISLALFFPSKAEISLSHDFFSGLVYSLLLIHSRLTDCATYSPVYPSSTGASISLPLDKSKQLLDPLLPVPIKEAQISASKDQRAVSTYSVTELPQTANPQFTVEDITLATADSSLSTTAIYQDEVGQSYVIAGTMNNNGFIVTRRHMEPNASITDTVLTDV